LSNGFAARNHPLYKSPLYFLLTLKYTKIALFYKIVLIKFIDNQDIAKNIAEIL